MKFTIHAVLLVLCAFPINGIAEPENWASWRGPDYGVVDISNPPTEWSETENIKWKTELPGEGQSTPIIWEEKIFLLAAIPVGEDDGEVLPAFGARGPTSKKITVPYQFAVLCLNRNDGKILWQKVVTEAKPHEGHHPSGSLAPYSPVTDGERLYCSFGSRGIYCLDFDGNIVWSKSGTHLKMAGRFGEGSSPILYNDLLIVLADHEGPSTITAYDKKTGDISWKKNRDEISSWSSPVLATFNGKPEIITSASNAIRSYHPDSGELNWECSGLTDCAAPSPVIANGIVYCTTGFRGASTMAIQLGNTGNLTETDSIRWSNKRVGSNVPSPLVYQDRLYVLRGYSADLSCFNANDGTVLYQRQRLEGMKHIYASPVATNEYIYFCGRDGMTTILKPGDTFEIVQQNQLDATLDASPVFLGDELYLRGRKAIYCIKDNA